MGREVDNEGNKCSFDEDECGFNPYCDECGHCGYIGCCGIKNWLEKHVRGKTNCKNEDSVIDEIIMYCTED